ncbi:MAG: acyltransferase family protein, partial [Lachnospiraceae bacterium]|nr:acyltransferase family protein [Lachnospiraceae bacterium]
FFVRNITFYQHITQSFLSFQWFVAAILVLYLAFPAYWYFFEKSSKKGVFTACALLLWLLLSMWLVGGSRGELYAFTNRIPVFLMGVLAGALLRERDIRLDRISWLLCLLLLILGAYFAYLTNYHDFYLLVPYSNCCIPNLLITVSGVCFLGRFFWCLDRYCKKLGKAILKIFAFYGTISLEFYCVQEYIATDVKNWLGENYQVTSEMCNLIVFTCIMAGTMILYGICRGIGCGLSRLSGKLKNDRG